MAEITDKQAKDAQSTAREIAEYGTSYDAWVELKKDPFVDKGISTVVAGMRELKMTAEADRLEQLRSEYLIVVMEAEELISKRKRELKAQEKVVMADAKRFAAKAKRTWY